MGAKMLKIEHAVIAMVLMLNCVTAHADFFDQLKRLTQDPTDSKKIVNAPPIDEPVSGPDGIIVTCKDIWDTLAPRPKTFDRMNIVSSSWTPEIVEFLLQTT